MSDTDPTANEPEPTELDEAVPDEFEGKEPGDVLVAPSDAAGNPIDPLTEEDMEDVHRRAHPQWYSDTDAKSSDPTAAAGQGFTDADDPNHPEVTHDED